MPDQNFDSLYDRLQKRVYGGLKGDVRDHVVKSKIQSLIPNLETERYCCADIGGGFGEISSWLLDKGHSVDYCDLSPKMLAHAQSHISKVHENNIRFHLGHFQNSLHAQYDLVHCQAVLEWLDKPDAGIEKLAELTKPNAYLALFFFNKESIRFKNLIKANLFAASREIKGDGSSLTPKHPLDKNKVFEKLESVGFEIQQWFGVRCFVDYLFPHADLSKPGLRESMIDKELELSEEEPYRSLARYIGVIAKRSK